MQTNQIPKHTHNFNKPVLVYGTGGNDKAQFTLYGSDGWRGSDIVGGGTTSTGGGQAHDNMPPYETIYMWKRTA